MKKLIKNNSAVSEVIGYALSLGVMAIIIASVYLTVSASIDQKLINSGSIVAENIADHVADNVLNTIYFKQNHPNGDYSIDVDVPLKISGKSYYIKLTNDKVWVNTSDNLISEYSPLFNVSKRECIDLNNDEVYGSRDYITISQSKSDYIYKFDFGSITSSAPWKKFEGYTRVSNKSLLDLSASLSFGNYHNITPIKVKNPLDEDININYPVLIQLDPSNFNIFSVSETASEIKFYDESNNELDFWVERWNPWNTSTSRIWVELNNIPIEGCYIFMKHGHDTPPSVSKSNGTKTFEMFYEDFDNASTISDLSSKWDFSMSNTPYLDDGKLVLDARAGGSYSDCYAKVKNVKPLNGVIEAKVRCTGDQRDCSIFARENGSIPNKYRYIFHSGLYSYPGASNIWDKYNCSISYYDNPGGLEDPTGHNQIPNMSSAGNPEISTDWNRLVLMMNEYDLAGGRYDYDNYRLNSYVTFNDSFDNFKNNHSNGGSLGLINQMGNESYVDWVFIRPYVGNDTDAASPDYKDRYPNTIVDGTISNLFSWSNTNNLNYKSLSGSNYVDDLSSDCVYSTFNKKFTITNLKPNCIYSIVFTVGDFFEGSGSIDIDMAIDANGQQKTIVLNDANFTTDWLKTTSDGSGEIEIDFNKNGANKYWSICSLTVQEGERKIILG